ncbi:DNA repair endonuclease XPF [Venturia canescens]|uniref:DNA repair endonuclease XPF n=1 Tax=Venturia canescens TaxID=32260 RepID=UPI001C9C93EB|nr:DNA repair endonuclease XPF [Venturia canescens]
MLEYENQMFLEALQEDGLMIVAKGLGLETVFANILKVYLDPGNLVLVLGTTDRDEEYFVNQLSTMGVTTMPKIISAQITSNERELTYLDGGVLFISGRILVVDLLKKRVPLDLVTGILVYRAQGILNSYQEAFALRLYRQANRTGFIKAFTNSALAFTVGFAQVERVMKALFVKNLYLWPRYHSIVNNSLSKNKPEVIELHVKLTQKMLNVQTCLLDVMNVIVKELKSLNKYLDLDELNVENAISKKFHKQLQTQLDPIWHQLSGATKQLVADLKYMGALLTRLIYEDCVSFYVMLNQLRSMDYAMKNTGWLVLDVVDDLFRHAKSRIYNVKDELKPEASPKWSALSEILAEIRTEMNKSKELKENEKKILILVSDGNTCYQLKNYLVMGAGGFLLYEAMRKLKHTSIKKSSNQKETESKSEPSPPVEEEIIENHESYVLTYSQKPVENVDENDKSFNAFEECSQVAGDDTTILETTEPVVLIHSLKRSGDPMALQRTLSEVVPSYVVMYGADVSAIRQLEVYQNNNPSINLKIYFLVYGGSVEEQGYLTSLRREKEAFEKLIKTKATMVIPSDQDGKSEALTHGPSIESEGNSRKGGLEGSAENVANKVIVDIREFRSELPALLHKRGIEIEPVTIIVGDYILSPEICVERKSISDLIMSLNSGRLYNQAVSMTRYYTKPMLLIEFDQNKSFCLQGNYYVSKDMKSSDITAKLQLLTMHFPKLKLIWSPSPQATAQLFEELKQGRAQPDSQVAAQIGLDDDVDDKRVMVEKYNPNIQNLVSKLPGVHSKNLRAILNKGVSLDGLVKMTKDELAAIISNKTDANALYAALHEKKKAEEASSSSTNRPVSKFRTRGLFTSKKS